MAEKKKKFVIIDGHALLHRAWHALPPLKTKDGLTVNVIYGYFTILFKILKDLKPDFLCTAFDLAGPTIRHEIYAEYKGTRKKQDDEFYAQIPLLQEALTNLDVPMYTKAGYEADDIIGTLSNRVIDENDDIEVIIVSGDNDLLQLVKPGITMYMPRTGVGNFKTFHTDEVIEKFRGLNPLQIIDYKALKGDSSDNIPGVPGVGDKTATNLLLEYKDINKLFKILKSNPDKLREKKELKFTDRIINLLIDNEEQSRMSYVLATIINDLEIDFDLEKTINHPFDMNIVNDICQKYEFFTLVDKVPDFMRGGKITKEEDNIELEYKLVNKDNELDNLINLLSQEKLISFDTETTGLDTRKAKLLGISFSFEKNKAYYVNLNHSSQKTWLNKLEKIFLDENITKIAHNLKYDWKILENHGVDIKGKLIDTMIASYILNPDRGHHDLDHLSFSILKRRTTTFKELTTTDNKQMSIGDLMQDIDLDKLSDYSCQDADFTFQLWKKFEIEITDLKLEKLFYEIEMPLVTILAQMENNGIKIDRNHFTKLENELQKRLEITDLAIYKHAGETFNINSPKQVKEVLFENLKLDSSNLKKTKTGISTSASELEKLKNQHQIIPLILDHRHLSKLLSTYIEALPKLIKDDGRIHSSFNQAVTRTGRLSSSDPNLQNIPIKDEAGRAIRKGFVANEGKVLISADYSQIELRIIAALSKDEEMLKAFNNGEDIHSSTAAKINGIELEDVTKELRNKAKAINFGVIYGLSAFGLANQINISRGEAQEFIDIYFALYKGIKSYLDNTIVEAMEKGYVETLFKRRRYLPEIESKIPAIRKAAERTAINTPIQGTAADLIKLAMVKINSEILEKNENVKMLLQVHDELIFEIDEDIAEEISQKIKTIMENIYDFGIPIIANVEINKSWGEMH